MRNFLKLWNKDDNPLTQFTTWLVRKRTKGYKPKAALAPIVSPPDRARRHRQRVWYRLFRRDSMRVGGPILTGARARRVAEACDPRHLLALPRYLRK